MLSFESNTINVLPSIAHSIICYQQRLIVHKPVSFYHINMSSNVAATTQAGRASAQSDATNAPRPSESQLILLGLSIDPSSITMPEPTASTITPACSYHSPMLQSLRARSDGTEGNAGLDRYLKEKSDQGAVVYLRPDNGLVSLYKGCTCAEQQGYASNV